MARPKDTDYNPFYQSYINQTMGCNSVTELIETHSQTITNFVLSIPQAKEDYQYAEDKWSVKDVLLHLIDAERVFTYRAMRFSRHDVTDLPGFDENNYTKYAGANKRSLNSIQEEFIANRKSTDLFLLSLSDSQLLQTGTANKNFITVNAIAFVIFGHLLHHKKILEERYL